jgi:tetratricopeptide (TPR) repeat protein
MPVDLDGTMDGTIAGAAAALERGDLAGAERAAQAALANSPAHPGALHVLGLVRVRQGRLNDGLVFMAQALQVQPRQPQLLLNFGRTLAALNEPGHAIAALSDAVRHQPDFAEAWVELGDQQRRLGQRAAAEESWRQAQTLEPARTELDAHRFDLLQELGRQEEALALIRKMLARTPSDPLLHRHCNNLLHLLGRDEQMFQSYDAAPPSTALLLDKADLLLEAGRMEEAQKTYAEALAREPENPQALVSLAGALARTGRHDEAMALLEGARRRQPDALMFTAAIGNAALLSGDAAKAAAMLEQVAMAAPHDHNTLARLSTAWRLLDDPRDEALMGYDALIRVFDLEPPPGFAGMDAFNVELEAYLAGLHPPTREHLGQSLRRGTQTSGHLFGGGHALVEQLRTRIDRAVARYIAELSADAAHPLRNRKSGGFAYSGSWSSRLSDCGFHVNHIHPMGWISSCYYVGLPGAVADEKARQGWIKFGEPGFDVGLGFRRAIQPRPGRLVLFPSYMWHGTIPFTGDEKRTTIAFDVVPT